MKKKLKLAELFKCRSVKQIVTLLTRYKITGKLGDDCDCPLANFAKKCGVKKPSVEHCGRCTSFETEDGNKITFGANLIREQFIRRFDDGGFPALVRQ